MVTQIANRLVRTFGEGQYLKKVVSEVIDGKTYYMTMQFIKDSNGKISYPYGHGAKADAIFDLFNEILFTGIYSSILCVLFLKLPIIKEIYDYYITDEYLLTAFFGLFIFIDIFNCFNARTHRINILANIMKNKVFIFIIGFITVIQLCMIYFGHNIFRTTDLTFIELQIMILLAFTVIPVDWIRKLYLKKKGILTGV